MVRYEVSGRPDPGIHTIRLPASKSICNRALIIAALCQGLDKLSNISEADDSQLLLKFLQSDNTGCINTGHGGTTFRFLLAYLVLAGADCTLEGSPRFNERPIGPLVEALRQLGGDITYLDKPGYPPVRIKPTSLKSTVIEMPADISSQFISAVLIIGPYLPDGIEIHLKGTIFSMPYIMMTLSIMEAYGAETNFDNNIIRVKNGSYTPVYFTIESDWSAASYIYALSAFCPENTFHLPGLTQDSRQGDSALMRYGTYFGIESKFDENGLTIQKSSPCKTGFQADLIKEPDLSLALAVMCAGCGMEGKFNGLETLRIKETDRITALHQELSKVGVQLYELPLVEMYKYYLKGNLSFKNKPVFMTYHDHRMAMSLATLGVFHPVIIDDPGVVTKSFPHYWEILKEIGMKVEEV
jgi:3-phosphoshikimate 1-carboxyvinyltransferase